MAGALTAGQRQRLLLLRRVGRARLVTHRDDLERIATFGPQGDGDLAIMMAVVNQICAEIATFGSDGYVNEGN